MAACRFGSPDLVTSITGTAATPTFAFDATNSNYFGLVGSFTSTNNGATCSFPTRSVGGGRTSTYAITPIIVTTSNFIGKTTTCDLLAPPSIISASGASTTYSGINCPSVTDNKFAPGTYTLRFSQPNVNGVPDITSRVFIVASPTFVTDHITATVIQTASAAAIPSSTTTVTSYSSTVTETPTPGADQTVTVTAWNSGVATTTVTDIVQSCSPSNIPTSSDTQISSSSSADVPSSTPASSSDSSSSIPASSSDIPSSTPASSSDIPSSTPASSSDIPSSTPASSTDATPTSTSSFVSSTPTPSLVISPNGECGAASGQTCLGSTFGNCCSAYGYCGATDIYCQAAEGCQAGFGDCIQPSPVSSSALPTSTVKVSTDGQCGGANGVCTGSGFGDCCSPYGWCGSSPDHCGAGCQGLFGTCNSSPSTLATVTGTAPQPTSTQKVSLDGSCGGTGGQTCLGSVFGDCCSEYGYCGNTALYCSTGCQSAFGTCTTPAKRSAQKPAKRAILGVGPDYTYPPIPHKTVTDGVTQAVTVTPTSGVKTTTVFEITTTTLPAVSGSIVTVTESAGITYTSTETVHATSTVCVAPIRRH
ncbi:uncharacterized protein BDR25DRAFT_342443 [Lindgomyces ingoldianus]|uniref:Uncharacterized protein n=1 Tax=Lindgomyces ingoldianus TaxID=673940 RepID=A0ACB6QXW2_9PLEO|nr:uncharacterized protein BDR25DRAFT_342443 [Lindgomyces ingoldianus]KAF2471824.1 hypothetical protein BDR25DRAFT_342443 [Lindgomyces ingoldianus]